MEKLKRYIEVAKTTSNKDINKLEKQIINIKDKIDAEYLNFVSVEALEDVLRDKQSYMNWKLGYVAALQHISNFIEELEKEDDMEFERAMELIDLDPVTERSLKADA